MTIKAVLVGVLAVGLAVTPALAAKKKPPASSCVKDKVLVALEMRMLQTELVVGALSCQMTPRYNDFVQAYKADLMGAHKTLLKFFARESKMEDYKSKTANEASQRSLANLPEFCTYTTALYDKLLGADKPSLATFVQTEPSAAHHGFEVCGSPSLVTASTTEGAAATPATPAADAKPTPRAKPAKKGHKPAADAAAAATPAGAATPEAAAAPAAASAAPTGTP